MQPWTARLVGGALSATLLTGTAACTFSPVKPDATVVITGRALSTTGAPLARASVHLYKEADIGEAIVGSALLLGSLGGICLLPGAPPVCHQGHSTTTDASGAYKFTLKGSDTQGLIGDESTLDLVVTAPKATAGGPSTTLRFKVGSATKALPDARLWNAAVHATTAAGQVRLNWSALPPNSGSAAAYTTYLYSPGTATVVYSAPATAHPAAIDGRLLEDRDASAGIGAASTLSGVHAYYSSASITVHPVVGAPPSRHQPCSAVTGTSTLATTPQTVCVVTDGDLAAPAGLVATNGQPVTGAVVDLGHARAISLVVARGVTGATIVEISTDGRVYRQVGTAAGTTVVVTLTGRPVARYVRVRSPNGLDESRMAELSVW
jgi:hypothetical protein